MYCLNEILLSDEMALKTVIKLLVVVVVDGMLNCLLVAIVVNHNDDDDVHVLHFVV